MSAKSEVIVIGGAPFSGKTTLAKRLAAQRGYALVASVIRSLDAVPTTAPLSPKVTKTEEVVASFDGNHGGLLSSPAKAVAATAQTAAIIESTRMCMSCSFLVELNRRLLH
jgi:hypothetical protein